MTSTIAHIADGKIFVAEHDDEGGQTDLAEYGYPVTPAGEDEGTSRSVHGGSSDSLAVEEDTNNACSVLIDNSWSVIGTPEFNGVALTVAVEAP